MFIHSIQHHVYSFFNGRIISCTFKTEQFTPSDFSRYNIFCPPQLYNAVNKRQAEYLAGRYCASICLQLLINNKPVVDLGEKREPLWPEGLAGAITHTHNEAICALAHKSNHAWVGIDKEIIISAETAKSIEYSIISEQEYTYFHKLIAESNVNISDFYLKLLSLTFSAKESLFKALYPSVQNYFDFKDATISHIDLDMQSCQLTLNKSLNESLKNGTVFKVQFFWQDNSVLTLVV